MLHCTNCGQDAPEGATACPHCRIRGAFRPSSPLAKIAPVSPFQNIENCQNCGSELPETADACSHCRMPRTVKNPPSAGKNGLFKIASFLN